MLIVLSNALYIVCRMTHPRLICGRRRRKAVSRNALDGDLGYLLGDILNTSFNATVSSHKFKAPPFNESLSLRSQSHGMSRHQNALRKFRPRVQPIFPDWNFRNSLRRSLPGSKSPGGCLALLDFMHGRVKAIHQDRLTPLTSDQWRAGDAEHEQQLVGPAASAVHSRPRAWKDDWIIKWRESGDWSRPNHASSIHRFVMQKNVLIFRASDYVVVKGRNSRCLTGPSIG